jgi:hypothetical protein
MVTPAASQRSALPCPRAVDVAETAMAMSTFPTSGMVHFYNSLQWLATLREDGA